MKYLEPFYLVIAGDVELLKQEVALGPTGWVKPVPLLDYLHTEFKAPKTTLEEAMVWMANRCNRWTLIASYINENHLNKALEDGQSGRHLLECVAEHIEEEYPGQVMVSFNKGFYVLVPQVRNLLEVTKAYYKGWPSEWEQVPVKMHDRSGKVITVEGTFAAGNINRLDLSFAATFLRLAVEGDVSDSQDAYKYWAGTCKREGVVHCENSFVIGGDGAHLKADTPLTIYRCKEYEKDTSLKIVK